MLQLGKPISAKTTSCKQMLLASEGPIIGVARPDRWKTDLSTVGAKRVLP